MRWPSSWHKCNSLLFRLLESHWGLGGLHQTGKLGIPYCHFPWGTTCKSICTRPSSFHLINCFTNIIKKKHQLSNIERGLGGEEGCHAYQFPWSEPLSISCWFPDYIKNLDSLVLAAKLSIQWKLFFCILNNMLLFTDSFS